MPSVERFKSAVDDLSKRFFTPAEFPLQDRAGSSQKAARRVMSQPEADLHGYADSLTKAELDDLLYSLVTCPQERVLELLIDRFNPRMVSLAWALFQYHPDSTALIRLVELAAPPHDTLPLSGGRLMLTEGFCNDPVRAVMMAMLEDNEYNEYKESSDRSESRESNESTETFLKDHGIIKDSPFHTRIMESLRAYNAPSAVTENIAEALETMLSKPSIKLDALLSRAASIKELQHSKQSGVMRLDFGTFSLYDPDPKSDVSFLFMDPAEGMAITPEGFAALGRPPDAKEYLFNRERKGVYRLEFFEFGQIHAEEMLDSCLTADN